MTNILFVGFSVTEEKKGYVYKISELFKNNHDVGVKQFSIGGATFELLPYILPEFLSKNMGSTVVFEISTCYRFKNSISEYNVILNDIDEVCRKYNCSPMFVGMYREGVDYRDDLLSLSIEYFARSRGYKYIDLITELLDQNTRIKYLRDGIHTTEEGALYYAEKIFREIPHDKVSRYNAWKQFDILKLGDLAHNEEVNIFKRGGYESTYIDINEGSEIQVSIPDQYFVKGLIYLMGPKSGDVLVSCLDTGFNRTVHMFDERCYYSRCSYQFFPEQKTRIVKLKQLDNTPSADLVKGEKDMGPRIGSVLGILITRSECFS